jgi:hypothetical protein
LKVRYALVLTALLCAGSLAAETDAQEPPPPAMGSGAVSSGEPQAQVRLVGEFSGFAGSGANARSLVAGLRHGAEITLAAPGDGGQSGATTRLVPPTRPMDYSNVRIALVLAREQLAQLGITQPTPGQLKAVLAGGGIASRTNGRAASPFLHPGVLHMRAGGASWAKISGTMGITLAQAMDSRPRQAAAASEDSSRQAAASATSAPISSASITKSSAGGPRTALVAKPAAAAQRPATAGPQPEVRIRNASVVVAADAAPRVETVAIPAQDGVQGGAVRMTDTVPGASGESTESDEVRAVE